MTTATAERPTTVAEPEIVPQTALARTEAPLPCRIKYPSVALQRFGLGSEEWKALVETVFPNATTVDSVILALCYCRARNLDVFKRVVHIVPIWNKELNRMVDTIWPGIGELRTTAFRTKCYAGRSRAEFGPDVERKVGNITLTFPEWAQVSVRRIMPTGETVEFAGPQVYWLETYAQSGRNDATPNSMWSKRPRGQLEKCAEAAALRAAFPEEIGNEYVAEEVGALQFVDPTTAPPKIIDGRSASDQLADMLEGKTAEPAQDEHPQGSDESNATESTGEESQEPDEFAPLENESDGGLYARFVKELEAASGKERIKLIVKGIERAAGNSWIGDDHQKDLANKIDAAEKRLKKKPAGTLV